VTPRVSVVSTVYNGGRYFDRAVPGILAQTLKDFEFILVDDGSSDDTLARLQVLAARDPRVRVFAPGRLGAAAAYNYGVTQARAPYVARQDFDDRSYPERLQRQVAYLDAHPKVGLVGGHYVLVDENRGERYVRMPPTEHEEIVLAMAKLIPMANTISTFRKRVWAEVGGIPVVNDLEDLLFWLNAVKAGWRIANPPDVMGEHFVHASSFFHRTYKYADRQRNLARVQAKVVRELRLPPWMYLYAAGRYGYAYCPALVKRVVRRTLGGSRERDV